LFGSFFSEPKGNGAKGNVMGKYAGGFKSMLLPAGPSSKKRDAGAGTGEKPAGCSEVSVTPVE
jgi:hypothetical protein